MRLLSCASETTKKKKSKKRENKQGLRAPNPVSFQSRDTRAKQRNMSSIFPPNKCALLASYPTPRHVTKRLLQDLTAPTAEDRWKCFAVNKYLLERKRKSNWIFEHRFYTLGGSTYDPLISLFPLNSRSDPDENMWINIFNFSRNLI